MLQIKQIQELKKEIKEHIANLKQLKGMLMIKEAELEAKDMLVIDLLWLLIDNGIDPIKEGYEDLVKKLGIDYDSKK